jgi:hypothetical protein
MVTVEPERLGKTITVTFLGLITMLIGGGYVILGGELAVRGIMWFVHPEGDP